MNEIAKALVLGAAATAAAWATGWALDAMFPRPQTKTEQDLEEAARALNEAMQALRVQVAEEAA